MSGTQRKSNTMSPGVERPKLNFEGVFGLTPIS